MQTHYRTSKEATLIVAMIMCFVAPFLIASLSIALPSIGREMHAEAISLSWMVTASTLMQAIFMVPFGRIGDLVGRKKLFFIGCAMFTVTCFLTIFSTSSLMLIIFL